MDFELEMTLARLRDAADLYRQLATARRQQDEGVRRDHHLTALDAEYKSDLAAAEKVGRSRNSEVRLLEDDLQSVEDKLRDRSSRQPVDAGTVLALADEIASLRKRRDALEQQLLDRWQQGDTAAAVLAGEREDAATERDKIARQKQDAADRAARADLAVPEIEGELAHLVKQLPARVAGSLRRIARRFPDPVADLLAGSCGGCGQSLPAQEAVDVDREKALIICQGCGRYVVARSSRKTRGWGE